jgi:hypothetical protein
MPKRTIMLAKRSTRIFQESNSISCRWITWLSRRKTTQGIQNPFSSNIATHEMISSCCARSRINGDGHTKFLDQPSSSLSVPSKHGTPQKQQGQAPVDIGIGRGYAAADRARESAAQAAEAVEAARQLFLSPREPTANMTNTKSASDNRPPPLPRHDAMRAPHLQYTRLTSMMLREHEIHNPPVQVWRRH